jgi:hypothetical protein
MQTLHHRTPDSPPRDLTPVAHTAAVLVIPVPFFKDHRFSQNVKE